MSRKIPTTVLLLLAGISLCGAEVKNKSHLEGIRHLYMNLVVEGAPDITSGQKLDLSDIMELQLRRGGIDLKTYVLNQPESNVPLVELTVNAEGRKTSGAFELVLRVRDHVTIDRNGERTVATTFVMRREGRADGSASEVRAIKAELRGLMGDFVEIFREVNPR